MHPAARCLPHPDVHRAGAGGDVAGPTQGVQGVHRAACGLGSRGGCCCCCCLGGWTERLTYCVRTYIHALLLSVNVCFKKNHRTHTHTHTPTTQHGLGLQQKSARAASEGACAVWQPLVGHTEQPTACARIPAGCLVVVERWLVVGCACVLMAAERRRDDGHVVVLSTTICCQRWICNTVTTIIDAAARATPPLPAQQKRQQQKKKEEGGRQRQENQGRGRQADHGGVSVML